MAHDVGIAATIGADERSAGSFGVRRIGGFVFGVSWVINVGLLLAAFGWVYFFGESRETIELMKRAAWWSESSAGVIRDPSRLGIGVTVGLVAIAAALVACVAMFASLFVGCGRFRTTRMWLVFTTIVCGWLGLAVSWQAVYWFGQQQRVKAVLPAAGAMVEALRSGWPTVDSQLPDIGPFLAYPISAPTALLPLGDAKFSNTALRFSAVERTGDAAMRFELAGAERGAWLEWRGDGSGPQSFVGGLDTKYEVGRIVRLGPEWFLVRYRAVGVARRE